MRETSEDTAIVVNVATREAMIRPELIASAIDIHVEVGPTRFILKSATVNERGQVELRGVLVFTDSVTTVGTAEEVTDQHFSAIELAVQHDRGDHADTARGDCPACAEIAEEI